MTIQFLAKFSQLLNLIEKERRLLFLGRLLGLTQVVKLLQLMITSRLYCIKLLFFTELSKSKIKFTNNLNYK